MADSLPYTKTTANELPKQWRAVTMIWLPNIKKWLLQQPFLVRKWLLQQPFLLRKWLLQQPFLLRKWLLQ